MREKHRNGQDDSNIAETSDPFTTTRATLNRQSISSVDYNRLKQGPANQLGGHVSASLSCPEGSANFFQEFHVN